MILLPDEEPHKSCYEEILRPTAVDGRIGQFTELPDDGPQLEPRLLARFHQKTRNLVRKGLNQGFTERVSDEDWAWDFLHHAHAANIAALGGRPKPKAHFDALRRIMPLGMQRLSIAMDETVPVAAMLTASFNKTVEYLVPTIQPEYRSRQPLSFLIFHGMIAAARSGDRLWNWGGTWHDQVKLHHFKAGFGAVDRSYSYLVHATAENLSVLREYRHDLASRFPYFYIYPFALLG
jgi:lipid II:glycine glycyltransferase (peptidoglycan interpeptide bridge formation enzyme)